jgi:hydrogenase nickel incorporation protein HypB
MCATCGCGETGVRVSSPHDHDHARPHVHPHAHPHSQTIILEQKVLAKNDQLAERNRYRLAERHIVAVNLMSSPGSGKTTLLERTIRDLSADRPIAVIEGDQETLLDADRIRRTGAPVVQVNTGAGCHLDAAMTHDALDALDPAEGSLIFIENVGNLVCPALFDLGESGKVVIISVTEGTDKPLKYPYMFAAADLVVVNKTDLLPYVDFDLAACRRHLAAINPRAEVVAVSATTGDHLGDWYGWLGAWGVTPVGQGFRGERR